MNRIFLCFTILLAVAFGLAYSALYFGVVDVSADTPHSAPVLQAIGWVRERAVAAASAGIAPPADLADSSRIRRGAGNYDAMCVECHLAPGVGNTELRSGLYPQPPELMRRTGAAESGQAAARRFWIIKHGIKASAMPAWSKGGMEDEAIWDLCAFLGILPTLSATDYRQLVAASSGHSHGGLDPHHSSAAEDVDGHDHHDEHTHAR